MRLAPAVLLVGGGAYSLIAASTTPFTLPADVLTGLAVAVMAVVIIVRWPRHARPDSGARAADPAARPPGHPYVPWVLFFAVFVGWEFYNYLAPGTRSDHPTFSSITDAIDRFYLLKSLLLGLAGCGLVHRPSGCLGAAAAPRSGAQAVSVSTASYVVWGALGVAMALLWWLSYARPAAVAHPSDVVGKLVTQPVLRVGVVLGLMWLGWHLFAR